MIENCDPCRDNGDIFILLHSLSQDVMYEWTFMSGVCLKKNESMDNTGCMKHCRKPYPLFTVHSNTVCLTLR